MLVELADNAGFCFGVKRAIDTAMETASKHRESRYVPYRPLIHNPQTVARLGELGIRTANTIADIDRGIVIIRSYGDALPKS